MLPIIQKSCMLFDVDVTDKNEAITLMADCLYKNGYLSDKKQFCQDVYDREKLYPTCIGNGICIPHGKSNQVKYTGICILRLNHSIFWAINQGKKEFVDFLVLIAVEESKADIECLKVLTELSKNLLHHSFVKDMKQKNVEDAYQLLTKRIAV